MAAESEAGLLKYAAYLGFVGVASLAVYAFVSSSREGELRRRCSATCLMRPNYSGVNRRAPSFTLKDRNGHDVSLDSYKGKVVVLNFWTKTCAPCMEEMPDLADLAKVFRGMKDVALLTVSTDENWDDVAMSIKGVLRGQEPPFPILFDPDAKIVGEKFGTKLFPETWIIDGRGVIRARFDGKRDWTNSAVVELVEQIRNNGYCPVEVDQDRPTRFKGEGAKICESLIGGT